jgi:hypothetical protein
MARQGRTAKPDEERQEDAREVLLELATRHFPSNVLLIDIVVGQVAHEKKAIFTYALVGVPNAHAIEEQLLGTDKAELEHVVRLVARKITQAA